MSFTKISGASSAKAAAVVPQQSQIEREAIRIFRHPVMQTSQRRIAEIFSADRNAGVDRQRDLIPLAAAEHAFAAVLTAVAETPHRPSIYWSLANAHPAPGIEVPGSRFGIENPDNLYRLACVDERYRYKITGRRAAAPPLDGGITLMPGQLGENMMANSIGYFGYENLAVDADGHFEITLDAKPAAGRPNHICIAGGKVLNFRDTHGDWVTQTPYQLAIECLDAPARVHRSDEQIAIRAAAYGEVMADYFLQYLEHAFFERRAPNDIIPPTPSGGNGGLVTQVAAQGWYQLAEDEALIVDVDLMGARYFGFQICNLWMISYDYTEHMSSLNHLEAQADEDGRVRFVISGADPGVFNWLDGSGHLAGTTTLRWQHVPNTRTPAADTVVHRVVKVAELDKVLPKGTRFADAQARAVQRAKRAAAWKRRCAIVYE